MWMRPDAWESRKSSAACAEGSTGVSQGYTRGKSVASEWQRVAQGYTRGKRHGKGVASDSTEGYMWMRPDAWESRKSLAAWADGITGVGTPGARHGKGVASDWQWWQ